MPTCVNGPDCDVERVMLYARLRIGFHSKTTFVSPSATSTFSTTVFNTARRSVSVAEVVSLAAVKTIAKLPLTVGEPDIVPVDVSTLRPSGNPVALKLVGE